MGSYNSNFMDVDLVDFFFTPAIMLRQQEPSKYKFVHPSTENQGQ